MTAMGCSSIKTSASHDLPLETGHPVEVLQGTPNETEVHDEVRIEVGTVIDLTAGAPGEGATETAAAGIGIMKMTDEDVIAVTMTGMEKDDVGKRKQFFPSNSLYFQKLRVGVFYHQGISSAGLVFLSSIHRSCHLP